MANNIIHRGELVDKIVRKSGYSLTKLADKLKISRNTLYNRFEKEELDYRFIVEIGSIIYYDFTRDFPDMKDEIDLLAIPLSSIAEGKEAELWRAEGKYTHLLEKYNKLLALLAKSANENELPSLKREIDQFLEQEKQTKPAK